MAAAYLFLLQQDDAKIDGKIYNIGYENHSLMKIADIVTLSAMSADNPLRALGDVNYWVNSWSYNIVETAHQFWMMAVIDLIIGRAEYPAS